MPDDEHKTKNRAENHARSAIISWSMSLLTTDMNYYDAERDKKCFSCPGDFKELSKRLSEAHTTQTNPGPRHGRPVHRPPTTR